MHISAVIPAFNEEKTVGKIVKILTSIDEIEETIVVSDGSVDHTAKVARQSGAKVVELPFNQGKGAAMKAGVNFSKGDAILFLDADLIGLTEHHVRELLQPIICGQAEMSIGIFGGGRFSTDLAQKVSPFLSGQRVVKKYILEQLSNMDMTRFGVEIALTRYVRRNRISYVNVTLEHMTHIMKEEKLGWKKGVLARMKMYWEIVKGFRTAKN